MLPLLLFERAGQECKSLLAVGRDFRIFITVNFVTAQERFLAVKRESNERALDFLNTDLDTAFTFVRIASDSGNDPETRSRNLANATRAYEAVSRLLAHLDRDELRANAFDAVKAKLDDLGANLKRLRQPESPDRS